MKIIPTENDLWFILLFYYNPCLYKFLVQYFVITLLLNGFPVNCKLSVIKSIYFIEIDCASRNLFFFLFNLLMYIYIRFFKEKKNCME